jgi:hypothetical protein
MSFEISPLKTILIRINMSIVWGLRFSRRCVDVGLLGCNAVLTCR